MRLIFVTGNSNKFAVAKTICGQANIEVEQVVTDIDEIQGEDPLLIIEDKARKAYEAVDKPVVVSDDSWYITALGGFPGAYMKSINAWFKAEDFLNLMRDKTDRSLLFSRLLAYYDGKEVVSFRKDCGGQIANQARGNSDIPWRNVCILEYDNGKTLAELDNNGTIDSIERLANNPEPWHDLVEWYTNSIHENRND